MVWHSEYAGHLTAQNGIVFYIGKQIQRKPCNPHNKKSRNKRLKCRSCSENGKKNKKDRGEYPPRKILQSRKTQDNSNQDEEKIFHGAWNVILNKDLRPASCSFVNMCSV